MIDLTEQLIAMPLEEFGARLQEMPRDEVVILARKLEEENDRLKRQLKKMDPELEPYQKKDGFRAFVLGKLRLCHDRLTEMKNEVVTLGVFFRLDEDGLPFFYYKAARALPAQYVEALLLKHGPYAPVMIAHHKVKPETVAADQWDDITLGAHSLNGVSCDSELHHTFFSR
jgi:hypothetical protein